MIWDKQIITLDSGESAEAVAPVIISASRSTDIPAFYSEWLFNRIKKGYVSWINPFNQSKQYISFKKARLFVFWSKNPKPIIPFLKILDDAGINYYFQITVNDYTLENLEPKVPSLEKRIETFIKLSEHIGKGKTIWRFDPLLLSDKLNVNSLLERIDFIGGQIHEHTDKLVFSFADINVYRKVNNNLSHLNDNYREFSSLEISSFAKGISEINKKWNLSLATCCEEVFLNNYGIEHNRCIDDELIVKLFSTDSSLMSWLGYAPGLFDDGAYVANPQFKDKGQRKVCGCIMSKDIGMYNTCNHLCHYCYANSSSKVVNKNVNNHNTELESII